MVEERISVGKVVATHGIKGEIKVIPLTDFPNRFRPGTRLIAEKGDCITNVTVTRARSQGKQIIIKLAEINDVQLAEKLCGSVLKVEPWEVEPLPEGRYYHFQIIDCKVISTGGVFLGRVTDILTTGANDVYVVQSSNEKEILIPALKTVVKQVNTDKKEIIVELPPGLID